MRKGSANTRARSAIVAMAVDVDYDFVFTAIVARHWLPAANERYTERPELAGVGIAADVLDAVTWGA